MRPFAKARSTGSAMGRLIPLIVVFAGGLCRLCVGVRRVFVLSFVVFATVFVLGVGSAFASGGFASCGALASVGGSSGSKPPVFEPGLKEEAIYATRAHIVEEVLTGEIEVSWQAEYATSEAGPWTVEGAGATEPNTSAGKFPYSVSVFVGTSPGLNFISQALVRKLNTGTGYYVCFHAKSVGGEAEKTFHFVTKTAMPPEIGGASFEVHATGPTLAAAKAEIENNGAVSGTEYHFEWALGESGKAPAENSPSWLAFTSGGSGTIGVAEDFGFPEAQVTGLAAETEYYARVKAKNEKGEAPVEVLPFRTPTTKPVVEVPRVRNVTGASAHLSGGFLPHGSETSWRFQYATSLTGPWSDVPGGGVFSQSQAEALPEGRAVPVEGSLTGLSPSTIYYVRLFAQSKAGEGEVCRNETGGAVVCEPISTARFGVVSFTTFGAPSPATFAVHGIHGEDLRVMGSVNPNSVPTSGEQVVSVEGGPTGGAFTLTFMGQTTVPIALTAPAEGPGSVGAALGDLSGVNHEVFVSGPDGGPYTVYFVGKNGEVALPPITGDGSSLTPSGAVKVTVVEAGGEGYDTRYHFEYVAQKQFVVPGAEGAFGKAISTPTVDLGSGDIIQYGGVDLPGLTPGETYHFRIVATSTSPGHPVVDGEDQTLTVPVPATSASGGVVACPNEALRTGPSARLSDCRAYEQLTPVDKGGAQEIFNYGGSFGQEGALVGGDGFHLMYGSVPVKWGAGPTAGQSPYFFSRARNDWQMTAATAQPEAGVSGYSPRLFGPGLGEFAFEAEWHTSPPIRSPNVEFKVGATGGPYTTVASVPAAKAPPGWVASSKDFSKLVLQVSDHTVLGHATHTLEGDDLYEYSLGGLRQVNVTGPGSGVTIGSCGANLAGSLGSIERVAASRHPVSGDGSRVYFEAVPVGGGCSEAKHVFVRVDGGREDARTVDIGAYTFVAANSAGDKALLEKTSGSNQGLYLYDEGLKTTEALPSSGIAIGAPLTVSEDLSTVYIRANLSKTFTISLYRYDVNSRRLLLVTELTVDALGRKFYSSSPDGRYFYFIAEMVAGLPGGGLEPSSQRIGPHAAFGQSSQVYRYDSVEALVQCVSCSSSFDPEPKRSALFTGGNAQTGIYEPVPASENGDYVFFDTLSALVSSDVNGEVSPEPGRSLGGEHSSTNYSLSSDVYEWRRDGVGGCTKSQGCVTLITSGGGGLLNILLGTSASGSDVFFSTNESLLRSDNDTAGDIYDARVNGGFAEPTGRPQCEGDACSTPVAAPNDLTPSSSTFQGAGNKPSPTLSKKPVPRCKAKPKKKCKTTPQKRRGKSKVKRRARHARTTGGQR